MFFRIALFCLLLHGLPARAQNFKDTSVLASGNFFKLAVSQDGVYKIDKAFLQQIGYPVREKVPQHIRLFTGHAGLLPQGNNIDRIDDLREVPLFKKGLDDGSFDEGDYILFFGKGPGSWQYDASSGRFSYQKHWYARQNFYFLKVDNEPGRSLAKAVPIPQGSPVTDVETYAHLIHHERDLLSLLQSGREWVGEEIKDQNPLEVSLSEALPGRAGPGIMEVSVVSAVPERSAFVVSLAGMELGSMTVEAAQSTVYGHKGREKRATFTIPSQSAGGKPLSLGIKRLQNSAEPAYLNRVDLQLEQELVYPGVPFVFRSTESLKNNFSRYIIKGASSNLSVWEVSDPFNPIILPSNRSGTSLSVVAPSSDLGEFVVFHPDAAGKPAFAGMVPNQNLHAMNAPELLIITHTAFAEEAGKLANFRRTNDNLSVSVVSTAQVYNEFSSGKQDVSAIRDFIRMLWGRNRQLKYVLLFGDASYDYFSDGAGDTNYVPVYQSKTSFHNVHSYASDDFFGFLEAGEGEWEEEGTSGDHSLDVAVGRLPVRSKEEANAIIDKLIHYPNQSSLGDWRIRTLFVADDGDANKHQHQSNYLATLSEEENPIYTSKRLFTDSHPKVRDRFGLSSPAMRAELQKEIERGALLLDFIGHGSETIWTSERILDIAHINDWENPNYMPVVLTATCAFGRFDDPVRVSGAEQMLLKPRGGAIALLTSSRPVFPNTSFDFSKAFYQAAFKDGLLYNGTVGDLFLRAKNNSIAGTTNRSFSLLGDPSMRLAVPQSNIILEKINGKPPQLIDSLHPMQKIRLQGNVQPNKDSNVAFEGELQLTVWGDYTAKSTLGGEGEASVFHYQNREDILYRGMASIREGRFDVEILLPEMPGEEYRNCKIVFYGTHESQPVDAAGFHLVKVGGQPEPAALDDKAPDITLWMENKGFQRGGNVSSRPMLIAEFRDESGISLLNNPEKGIKLVIDGREDEAIIISSYYKALHDTYKEGVIEFRLGTLENGEHHLKLSASDTRGNRREVQTHFVVSEQDAFILKGVEVYPNPTNGELNIKVLLNTQDSTHECQLSFYGSDGRMVMDRSGLLYPDEHGYSLLNFDLQQYNFRPGLYFLKLQLGLTDSQQKHHPVLRFIYSR